MVAGRHTFLCTKLLSLKNLFLSSAMKGRRQSRRQQRCTSTLICQCVYVYTLQRMRPVCFRGAAHPAASVLATYAAHTRVRCVSPHVKVHMCGYIVCH